MKAEIWMTPDQAVTKGYADRVEGATAQGAQPVEPAPFPYTAYHHAPSRMVALARANHWDRNRKPTAQAATTPKENGAAMPTEEEIQARIDAAVAAERAKPKTTEPVPDAAVPAPVAALMRSEASAIAKACSDGGVPGMTASLLAEGVTLAVAQSRIGQAGTIKDMVALARQGTPGIPADFAETMIAAGKTVDGVRAELFNQMVAKGAGTDDAGERRFHRAGAGGADHGGEAPTLQTGKPTAAVRSRGVALMAAEVERQGMTPKRRA
jgi:ATP-dependent Clp protease protease subunit